MRFSVSALVVAGVTLAGSTWATGAEPAPEEKTGIKVGDRAPGFALEDQDGEERTLSGLLEDGPLAVVFYRSADW